MELLLLLLRVLNTVLHSSCLVKRTPVSQADARCVTSVRLHSSDQMNFGSGYLSTTAIINNWNVELLHDEVREN